MTRRNPVYLDVNPSQVITFDYFPRKYLATKLRLSNPTHGNVAFKVKVTVPTCYLVKPHIGYLAPDSFIDIDITMQPTSYNPQTAAALTDKFLVNAFLIDENVDAIALNDNVRLNKMWEGIPKSSIQADKIPVLLNFDHMLAGNFSPNDKSEPQKNVWESSTTPRAPSVKDGSNTNDEGESDKIERENNNEREAPKKGLAVIEDHDESISTGSNVEDEQEILIKKITTLEKMIVHLQTENVIMDQRNQTLADKIKAQEKIKDELYNENEHILHSLKTLKSGVHNRKELNSKGLPDFFDKTFQLWHLVVVVIVSLLLGVLLGVK